MAEFWRALRTLKALQADQAKPVERAADALALAAPESRRAARATVAPRAKPNGPERRAGRPLECVPSEPPAPGRALHEQAAPWLPNEPETGPARHAAVASASQPQPLIGQTIAADGAPATAAALLRSMPDVGC
jgi:hypothetical protein